MPDIIQPGTVAPDFTLTANNHENINLRSFRGQPVVLVFYPADWSGVCGDQLSMYTEIESEFKKHNAQLIGVSVDGKWSHKAFAETKKIGFPIVSDFEPKGAVARSFGVYNAGAGVAERALVVIDADGVVRWSDVSPMMTNPGADGILTALDQLSGAAV